MKRGGDNGAEFDSKEDLSPRAQKKPRVDDLGNDTEAVQQVTPIPGSFFGRIKSWWQGSSSSAGDGGENLYYGNGEGVGVLSFDSPIKKTNQSLTPPNSANSTASSNAGVSSGKPRGILVSCRVMQRQNNISVSFEINGDQRPENTRGDHSTSHLAIIRALMSVAESGGIRTACRAMRKLGEVALEGDYRQELSDIVEPEVYGAGDRKDIVEILRASGKTRLAKIANDDLKYAKVDKLAGYLSELASCVLSGASQHSLATFHSRGRVVEESNHGDLTKGAARALVALDTICGLCNNNIPERELMGQLESLVDGLASRVRQGSNTEDDHIMRYGLNRYYQDSGTKAEALKTVLQQNLDIMNGGQSTAQEKESAKQQSLISLREIRDDLLSREESEFNLPRISGFIGNLLDYNKVVKFNLSEAVDSDSGLSLQMQKNKMNSIFNADKCDVYYRGDEENCVATVNRSSLDDLIAVLSRHLKIISAAFPNLGKIMKERQDIIIQEEEKGVYSSDDRASFPIVRNFLQHEVLDKGGWKTLKYLAKIETKKGAITASKGVDVSYLWNKIINPEPSLYTTPSSARNLNRALEEKGITR